MNVTVTLKDGSKIYPSYDPQHTLQAVGFYQDLYNQDEILGYKIVLNNGTLLAIGGSN